MSESPECGVTRDPYVALRVPAYRWFLVGSFLSNIGRHMGTLAAGWQVYQWTRSPAALGLVGLIHFFPFLALALPAGHLADRINRRKILTVTLVASSLVSVGLALIAIQAERIPSHSILEEANRSIRAAAGIFDREARVTTFTAPALPLVFLFLLINSVLRVLSNPARATLVPLLLPPEKLGNAITWNSGAFGVASMAGPALGGFVIAGAGYEGAYVCEAVLSLTMAVLLIRVRYTEPKKPVENRSWRTVVAGVEFIWRRKAILAASGLDLFAVLLGGAVALLPVYAEEILHVGPVGLGWLRAAPAIGAFLMAMAIAHLPQMKRPGILLLWSVAAFGVANIVFGISTWAWLSFVALFMAGAFDNISVVVRQSLVQLLTPNHLRGRVTAVNQIFIVSSNELGAFRAGTMAGLFGPVAAVVLGGVGTILVVLGVARWLPEIKTIDRLDRLRAE